MSAPNGRANGSAIDNPSPLAVQALLPPAMMKPHTGPQFSTDQIKQLIAELEVPFDPAVIEWRVTATTKSGKLRGQVIPYADPRAYTDRLNSSFTPAGWTRKYTVHTSANFERRPDQKTVAKVFVTCELTIFGLGSHSATGEEWTDNDNAGTSAEAQAFKPLPCYSWNTGRHASWNQCRNQARQPGRYWRTYRNSRAAVRLPMMRLPSSYAASRY